MIQIQAIDKTFNPQTNRAHHALRQVSLTITPGDFITIVGGNGAGKSTFLNAIAGSFPLDAGAILIEGKDISHQSESKRAQTISRVYQNPLQGTAPRMTVAENLSLAQRRGCRRGLKRGKTSQEIEQFYQQLQAMNLGLEHRLNSEMGVLSGGQRQAIALLMATIRAPKLLLLDEHTAALDPKTQRMMMELTQEKITTDHLTALMITHQLSDAIEYGNRLIVMHQGEIVRDLSAEEKAQLTTTSLYELLASYDVKEKHSK
ncbi:ABC transporter ATP-binding protein [Atopobacter phocae]|uniref:ABC transporter ATP-binding protein n=1 Tax=Atopobacter phocae TaxID=136492 RepID=UPI00047150CF|nr:ATP-binding cassette domain-containing protein [Atopobacter phocae]